MPATSLKSALAAVAAAERAAFKSVRPHLETLRDALAKELDGVPENVSSSGFSHLNSWRASVASFLQSMEVLENQYSGDEEEGA